MKYICKTLDFKIEEPTVISFGKFDGLHRGHELLVQWMKQLKKEKDLKSVAFTFDIPPKTHLLSLEQKSLTTKKEKLYIFAQSGVDYLVECPFVDEVRQMQAEEFIAWIVKSLHVKQIVVGTDFRYGYQRKGDYLLLQRLEKKYGYQTVVVDKLKEDGKDVSSTYIRNLLCEGNLQKANRLLGYPFFMRGEVVHGQALGRTIGIPTLNMIPSEDKMLPPNGVYITRVKMDEKNYCGVTNIGCRPTVSDTKQISVETYVIDFSEQIYGKTVSVEFLSFLREERKFEHLSELKSQMEKDIDAAKMYFQKNI